MKNLKIGLKLLLGFGAVLLIFIISVFFTWQYIKVAEKGNKFMITGPMQGMKLAAALDAASYELFMAARNVRYREDQASIEAYKARLADYTKVENAVWTLNREQPDLRSAEHVVK